MGFIQATAHIAPSGAPLSNTYVCFHKNSISFTPTDDLKSYVLAGTAYRWASKALRDEGKSNLGGQTVKVTVTATGFLARTTEWIYQQLYVALKDVEISPGVKQYPGTLTDDL
jgi:hypothetical protein